MTILREWRGRAEAGMQEAVLEHYRTNLRDQMAASPGFISAAFGRRELGRMVEFILVTQWRDMDSVREFTGAAPEKAVLPPGTSDVLSDADSFVRLYDIVDQA